MARRKTSHHRRHNHVSDSGTRHHRRHRLSDGGRLMDGWVPNGQQLTHGAISGASYQGLRLLIEKFLSPMLVSVPAPWDGVIKEIAASYGVFAGARLVLKGAMQHDVQVGAIAVATNMVTSLLVAPAVLKALGLSGYGNLGQQAAPRAPLQDYAMLRKQQAIAGGGMPAISAPRMSVIPGGRARARVSGYRSMYAVS